MEVWKIVLDMRHQKWEGNAENSEKNIKGKVHQVLEVFTNSVKWLEKV